MRWRLSHRADPNALVLANRHYNRQTPESPQFVGPGRCLVLVAGEPVAALWVTLWQEKIDHAWNKCWANTLFRNEGAGLSSELIREAVAATRFKYGPPPRDGMITFVDAGKTRKKRDPGRCYRRAGFKHIGFTKGGLYVLQMSAEDMPASCAAVGATENLFADLTCRLAMD